MTGEKPSAWILWLPLAQWWYNTNFHTSLNSSPYEVVFGQSPPLHIPYIPGDSAIEAVDRTLSAREEALQIIKRQLAKAQNQMKQMADKNISKREFEVGIWVFLKLHLRQFTLLQKNSHKLSPKYCGPFLITERIGKVAYRLKLSNAARIHDVFHLSFIKKKWYREDDIRVMNELPRCLLQADPSEFVPKRVLDMKFIKKANKAITMWLIQWKDRPVADNSWEPAEDIRKRFPDFSPNS